MEVPVPTLADIARDVGCSITTASRALAGYADVSATTRERVIASARKLDYHPNAIARQLQGKRTRTVAYAAGPEAGGREDLVFRDLLAVLAHECAERDLDLLLVSPHWREGPSGLARLVQRKRADGVIVADTREGDARLRVLAAEGVPYVAFGRTGADEGLPFVDVDGRAGMVAVMAHLVGLGHRRIAYLTGPAGRHFVGDRRAGYEAGLRLAGLTMDPDLCQRDLCGPTQICRAVRQLFDLPAPPTAIAAMSDMIAVQALPELQRRGLRVGQDVALTGFDETPLAPVVSPPLTSVRQPFAAACRLLLQSLEKRIARPDAPTRGDLVCPELVVRASSLGPYPPDTASSGTVPLP